VRSRTTEIADPADLTRAEHGARYLWWRGLAEAGAPPVEALPRVETLPDSGHLVVVRRVAPGAYEYLHYGAEIAALSGFDLTGRRLAAAAPLHDQVETDVAALYLRRYEDALARGRALAVLNQGKRLSRVHAWERLLLPFGRADEIGARVVVDVRPHMFRHEVLASLSQIAKFGSATLEPERGPDGRIVDFLLLEATELAPVLGEAPWRLSELLGAEVGPDLVERLTSASDGGCVRAATRRIDGPDGGRHVRIEAFAAPVRPFVTVYDVTAETAALIVADETRRRLEDSEARFRDFATSGTDWFWQTDENHRFVEFSTDLAFADYRINKNVGRTRREIDVIPEDRPTIEAHMRDLEARREFRGLVYRVRTAEGLLALRVSGKPFYGPDGRFLGYRGSGANVTAEMRRTQELADSRAALERAESMAKIGHWRWDSASGELSCSSSLCAIFGYGSPPAALADVAARLHEEDRSLLRGALEKVSGGAASVQFEARLRRSSDGAWRHGRFVVESGEGREAGFAVYGVVHDVTDLATAQALLKRRSEELSNANRLGRLGDWSYRLGEETVSWSDEVFELLRYERASLSLVRSDLLGLYLDGDRERLLAAQAEVVRTGEVASLDVRIRRGDGTVGDFVVTTKAERDPSGRITGFVGTIQDISERKDAERRLAKLAYADPLTGLGNRAAFQRELDRAVADVAETGETAALLLLDLDQFKEVNDGLGHAAGDALLVRVAESLGVEVPARAFLARLGGDEFALVLRRTSREAATALARRLTERIGLPMRLPQGEVCVGTSIGVAFLPDDGPTAEIVLRNADLALYRAKDSGRGRHHLYDPTLEADIQARLGLTRDLRRALEAGGLEARYQPQVDLRYGRVVGFEALMRWRHPERGYVPPSEFIPLAEGSSLICDLGAWILDEACRQARAWRAAGAPPREVSINVSAAQLWHGDLVEVVERALTSSGLDPRLVTLEVTESVFIDQSKGRVRRTFEALRELGVSLALDDFGTGYSSLGYLNQLPFQKLKIDRCFVQDVERSAARRRLLEGIVALGKGLGMTVVAEGVETEAQLAIVREMRCDLVQGFVFARPVEAAEVAETAAAVEREAAAFLAGSPGRSRAPLRA
jgi:diguanylate cyclase (GGDEF)-like protein/PAS domain S-box-containing protein